MEITYDETVDALYIRFRHAQVVTEHWAEGVAADFDEQGNLVGIEVLDALQRAGDKPAFANIAVTDLAKQALMGSGAPGHKKRAS